jgi:hypothetical protein
LIEKMLLSGSLKKATLEFHLALTQFREVWPLRPVRWKQTVIGFLDEALADHDAGRQSAGPSPREKVIP